MTLLSRILNASIESPTVPISSQSIVEFIGGGKASTAGKMVTEENALGMAGVYRAVNLLAGTTASLPLHVYRKKPDGSRQLMTTGQAATLLDDPHPDMTPLEVWEIVVGHLCLWGNAYLRKVRRRVDAVGVVRELWPIHPGRVKAGRASDGSKVYLIDGQDVFTDEEILHIPLFGYDGVCGVSPIRLAREGIGLALAAEEYGAKLFGSGSLATGILQTEQRLTEPQATALQERWKAKRAGLASAHETIILDRGASFHQLTIPPEDAQFLESRKFQVTEIARWYGIPPHMLGDTEKSTSWGTGIQQQSIGFVVYTLRPWLSRIEQRLTKMLRPQAVFAKYAVEGLLRGDSTERAAFYRVMFELGAFSTNDILQLEDRAPVEGGDVRYRPLNLGVLGMPDPGTDPASPDGDGAAPAPTDAERARAAVEAIQKVYLGVGVVVTDEEARDLIRAAGADGLTGPLPTPPDPGTPPADTPPPAPDPTEEVA